MVSTMNRIISMSVYGNNPRYIRGAIRQIELSQKFYPDFTVRIYTENGTPYLGLPCQVFEQKMENIPMFWRYFPWFESPDNITLIRDADGRITVREAMAVNEWLESDKTFHTFKDHEAHYEFPVIGCTPGFKGQMPYSVRVAFDNYRKQNYSYIIDQIFLRDYVWPVVAKNAMVHEMTKGWFDTTRHKLINRYDFAGNGFDENDMPLYPPTMAEMATFNVKNLPPSAKFNEGRMDE